MPNAWLQRRYLSFGFWVSALGIMIKRLKVGFGIWDLGFKVKEFKTLGRRVSAYVPTPGVRGDAKHPNPKIP